jgi:hypothetical protein
VGDTHIKEANARKLLKGFKNFAQVNSESVDDLVLQINGIVNKLRELGETMEDKRMVRKIMHVMLKKYDQIIVAIEMFSDLNTLKIEELIGKLRVAEDRIIDNETTKVGAGVGRLLLTEQ